MRGYKKIYFQDNIGIENISVIQLANIIEELGGEVFQISEAGIIFYKLYSEIDHVDFEQAVKDEIYSFTN